MPTSDPHEIDVAFDAVTAIVHDRLSRNERIRRNLPGDGRVRIDRQLPFLCVYRSPPVGPDAGTLDLATTEAAYLFAPGAATHEAGILRLVGEIADTMHEHFGAFLLIEIWSDDDRPEDLAPRHATRPGFRIVTAHAEELQPTLTALQDALAQVKSQGWPADVALVESQEPAPTGQAPLSALMDKPDCYAIGIAVRPVYRDYHTGAVFPRVLQSMRRQLAMALRRSIFAFTGLHIEATRQSPAHYQSLGPSALVKAARLVDQQLSEVSQSFDFVLQTVPLNTATAWEEFAESGFSNTPKLYYRPLPYDPGELKRRLFEIPMDRIEDVTLIELFEQKQDHLDRQLTALKNIDSKSFFYDSVQLYGTPDGELRRLARSILAHAANCAGDGEPRPESIGAAEIVTAARDQIDAYRQISPAFVASVELRNDLAAGLMVAKDRLMVAQTATVARNTLEPLLHHEVGTHLLTYVNGKQQPFQQLYAGLAGYEELQEGLAVLAEFLAGGLTLTRLRTLACRVLAVQALVEGESFLSTFQLLHDEHRQPPRSAFMTTLRVFRGGGLTKDAIYLRGLRELAAYLRKGHDLEPLYVGKIALGHVPMVQELRRRGIVHPPAVLPQLLDDANAELRLQRFRDHSLLELVTEAP
jgi:uncharacterized protein (TIGR02421 family)